MRRCDVCNGNDIGILLDGLSVSREVEGEERIWKYQLLKCRRCGLGFVDPKPSWQRLCSFYEGGYGCYVAGGSGRIGGKGLLKHWVASSRYATYQKTDLLRLLETAFGVVAEWITGRTVVFSLGIPVQLAKDARIFELGYGSGAWLVSMANLGYTQLAGYDIDANSDNASRLVARGIDVSGGNFLENDYPRSNYDCICLEHVLEHLWQPREVLAKCHQMLKPGGLLLLNLPCLDSWLAQLSLANWPHLDLPRHLYHYTPRSVALLLESVGFEVVQVKPYGIPIHVPIWLSAMLRSRNVQWIKIPQILFLPFAPGYRALCSVAGKGEGQTVWCRKGTCR